MRLNKAAPVLTVFQGRFVRAGDPKRGDESELRSIDESPVASRSWVDFKPATSDPRSTSANFSSAKRRRDCAATQLVLDRRSANIGFNSPAADGRASAVAHLQRGTGSSCARHRTARDAQLDWEQHCSFQRANCGPGVSTVCFPGAPAIPPSGGSRDPNIWRPAAKSLSIQLQASARPIVVAASDRATTAASTSARRPYDADHF